MAIGDIKILEQASMSGRGARLYNVAAGATTINPGEPVVLPTGLGATTVIPAPTNSPVASSDYFVGIAATTSTQTSGTAGTVGVYPADPLITYIIKPKVPTSWDTQAEYDALVGKSVLLDLTSGTYTILATNPQVNTNGCVIQAMNINEHPGMVAFTVKTAAINLR